MTERSTLQELVERDLQARQLGTLKEFVAARRARSSWAVIARELSEAIGREVSDETLRRWFVDRIQVEVRVA